MLFNNPWIDFSHLFKAIKGKKVIFWGCGGWFEKTMKMYKFNVTHLVDTSKNQQGLAVHHGYDVLDPSSLKKIKNKNKFYIIIASTAFYEIFEDLNKYGFKAGVNYCVTPLLQNYKIIEDILCHKQTLILSSSDSAKNSSLKGGGIYIYDTGNCKMEKKISGITRGFDRYKDNYFVVDALRGVRILDKKFKDIDGFKLPVQSIPHGLAIDHKKKLIYVVLCLSDKIGVFDMKSFKMVHSISMTDKTDKTGVYHHHMNDICLNESSLYISMFSRTGSLQINYYDGAIVEYDLDAGRVVGTVVENLWQPHSVRIINGSLCYLDSMRGRLHTTSQVVETHFHGFVRGLDYDGRYYYIGQSLHRYFDRMAGSSNNISMDCGFFMFDSSSKASKFFPAPTLRDINTLKLLHPFPGTK